MKRIALVVLLALLAATSVRAQQPFRQASLTAASSACPDAGCMTQDVQGLGSVGFQITGTFTATIQFEGSIDGTTFVTMAALPNAGSATVTSATSTGLWTAQVVGFRSIRWRVSAFTSGTAVVTSQAITAVARSLFPYVGPSVLVGDGTACSAPSISFASSTTTGFYLAGGNVLTCIGGSNVGGFDATGFVVNQTTLHWSDIFMRRSAAKTLTFDADGADGLLTLIRMVSPVAIGPIGSGYAATGNVRFSNQTGIGWRNAANSGDYALYLDNNNLLQIQAASNITAGTDVTVASASDVARFRYKASITPASGGAANCATQAAGFKAAALTADCVIATIPAGQKIVGAYADVTAGFTCSGTCTGTKVFTMGISAGGTEVFAAALNVVAVARFGLADADMGSQMTRAAAIQGGYLPSWTGATTITARFTSGTGNWGNAAATFVNAGSVTFTIVTEQEK